MIKSLIAIFFSFMFLSLLMVPSMFMVFDEPVDMSYIYDVSEDEEEKGKESSKEFENFVVELDLENEGICSTAHNQFLEYAFNAYSKPHLNLIFSPPDVL